MRITQTLLSIGALLVLTACGADAEEATQDPQSKAASSTKSTPKANHDANSGRFQVQAGDVIKFDHTGKKAKSWNNRNDYWEFAGNGAKLKIAGRFPDSSPGEEQASIDLEYNNVHLQFMYQVGEKRTRVSCSTAQEPVGQIKRTVNPDLSSSGTFNIDFVRCRNTYTEETIAEISTPIVVKGQFENVASKESLF